MVLAIERQWNAVNRLKQVVSSAAIFKLTKSLGLSDTWI